VVPKDLREKKGIDYKKKFAPIEKWMPSSDPTIAAKDALQPHKLDIECFTEWCNTKGNSYVPISWHHSKDCMWKTSAS